jgi:hypothetical protein
VRSWDRDQLTELARSYAPGRVRLVLSGQGERPLAGILTVARTKTGLAEQTTVVVPLGVDDQADAGAAALRGVLEQLQPIGGVAYRYVSTPDAAVPPIFVAPPRPLSFLLGARIARAATVLDRLESVADVERIGSQKNPGALVSMRRDTTPADLSAAGVVGEDLVRRFAGLRGETRRAS